MRDPLRQYLDTNYGYQEVDKTRLPGFTTLSKNHWHPCCQEHPDDPLVAKDVELDTPKVKELSTYKCPRGHEYTASEPFVIETPDILCNSGPLCIYCYANWLHVNIGAEEIE